MKGAVRFLFEQKGAKVTKRGIGWRSVRSEVPVVAGRWQAGSGQGNKRPRNWWFLEVVRFGCRAVVGKEDDVWEADG